MRQTISGLIAAFAVVTVSAVPALACGGGGLLQSSCSPCGQAYVSPCAQPEVYVAPTPTVVETGCDACGGGWVRERLPDPVQQYYYVNQGPTYTGPGNYAPYPTYQEGAVSSWRAYRHRPHHYGYDGGRYADATPHYYDGYRSHRRFHSWREHTGYGYPERRSLRYGYTPHRYGYESHRYGYEARRSYTSHFRLPPREFYPRHHSLRYGYGAPDRAPRHYGYREHTLRRYY
jgi:hypothetical protein